jgi:hypothetical protein
MDLPRQQKNENYQYRKLNVKLPQQVENANRTCSNSLEHTTSASSTTNSNCQPAHVFYSTEELKKRDAQVLPLEKDAILKKLTLFWTFLDSFSHDFHVVEEMIFLDQWPLIRTHEGLIVSIAYAKNRYYY